MMYYVFEGVGDDGFVEEGAESIDGIQKVDDKTVQFTTKEEMPITTFENSYARYLLTLPKHVIEQYSEEELSTADWFNHPDVVSGPFIVTDFDVDHYISYEANKDYWKGSAQDRQAKHQNRRRQSAVCRSAIRRNRYHPADDE